MDQYDKVSLHALPLTVIIGPDVWHRSRAQPIYLTLHIYTSLAVAGKTDDVSDTVHYGHLGKKVQDAVSNAQQFTSLFHLAEGVCRVVFHDEEFRSVMAVKVEAEAQKVLLQAEGLYVRIMRLRDGQVSNFKCKDDIIQIRELTTFIIIGVNPPERLSKQRVLTTITFHLPSETSQNATLLPVFLHYEICQNLIKHIESTSFLTLEAFAASVARLACMLYDPSIRVTILAQKPSAVSFGHSSGVEITRDRSFFGLEG